MMDLYETLKERFPLMYPHGDVYVEEGWHHIILNLSAMIQNRIDSINERAKRFPHLNYEPIEQVVVGQIKEKFGGLRFYYDGGDHYIAGLVDMAECWADHTCEVCGEPGKSRDLSWVKTLCDEHYEQRKSKQIG